MRLIEQRRGRPLDLVDVVQLQRTRAGVHPLRAQSQKLRQPLGQPWRLALQLQPNRRQAVTLLQQRAHVVQQVRVFLIVVLLAQADVRVARDGDDRLLGHVVDLEYLLQVRGDDHLGADEAHAATGQHDDPRQHRRHVHDAQHRGLFAAGGLLAPARLLAALVLLLFLVLILLLAAERQQCRRVQRLVAQVRERVAPVDHLRRQQRPDVLLVVVLQVRLLVRRQRLIGGLGHARVVQRVHQLLVDGVAALDQRPHRRADGAHLLAGLQAGLVVRLLRRQHVHVDQAAHAHHEELVKVAGEYGHEPQPLHQRHVGIRRLCQHALIEFQPAQLAILGIAHVPLQNRRVFHFGNLPPGKGHNFLCYFYYNRHLPVFNCQSSKKHGHKCVNVSIFDFRDLSRREKCAIIC